MWRTGFDVQRNKQMKAMGVLITTEADTVSAMMYRVSQADKAMRMDMKFFKTKGTSERWNHGKLAS